MSNHTDFTAFFNPMSNLEFRNTVEIGVSTLFVFGKNSVSAFNGIADSRRINLEEHVVDKENRFERNVHFGFVFGACKSDTHGIAGVHKNAHVRNKKKTGKLYSNGSGKTRIDIHRNIGKHDEVNHVKNSTAQNDMRLDPNSEIKECISEVKEDMFGYNPFVGEENKCSVGSFHATLNNCYGGVSQNNLKERRDNICMLSNEMTKLNVNGFQNKEGAQKDEFCNSNFCVNSSFKARNEVESLGFHKNGLCFSEGERFRFGDIDNRDDDISYEIRNPLEHFHHEKEPAYEFCESEQNSSDLKSGNSAASCRPLFIFHAKNDIGKSHIPPNALNRNQGLRTSQVSSMDPVINLNSCVFDESSISNSDCSNTSKSRFPLRKAGVNMRSRFVNDKNSKKEQRKHIRGFQADMSHSSNFVWPKSVYPTKMTIEAHNECLSPMDFSPYGENCSQEQHVDKNHESVNHTNNKDDCKVNKADGVTFNVKIDTGFRFSPEREESNHGVTFATTSKIVEDAPLKHFMFTSFSSGKPGRRHKSYGHKYKRKDATFSSANSSSQSSSASCTSSRFTEAKGEDNVFNKNSEDKSKSPAQSVEGPNTLLTMLEKTCQKMRLRGNQAYKDGRFAKAERYYTSAVNIVPSDLRKTCFPEDLVLCYSNRAAVRMSLGRIREAIEDCLFAIELDSSFHKAHIRAANCCLLLGEVREATQHYNKCMESGSIMCLDRRIVLEAYKGVKDAEKVDNYIEHCFKLLEKRTPDSASCVLGEIDDALSISPHSETLIELKVGALYTLQKYEEAICLCKETKIAAEKNFPYSRSSWRFHLESISLFHLGKLEAALELLDNNSEGTYFLEDCWKGKLDSRTQFAGVMRKLLQQKNAGNKSFHSGKYSQAVENYTAALSENVDSHPFVAVCFCNRAAAYKALGEITNAIADCSIAIALDGTYQKAISRRATLYEMIGEYNRAEGDLSKLVDVLELQYSELKNKSDGTPGKYSDKGTELGVARSKLSVIADKAKKGLSINFHLILGINESDSAAEVKKAYRKAALRHHPDKAGQLLTKNGSGRRGETWKNILKAIYNDADLLFKIIGEAYSVLSDRHKKAAEVGEEERNMRNATQQSQYSSNTNNYPMKGNHSAHFRRSPYNQKWNWHNT